MAYAGNITEYQAAGIYGTTVVGELLYAKKVESATNHWNSAMIIGSRQDNELVVGFFPDVDSGQEGTPGDIGPLWPDTPHTYVEKDSDIKSSGTAKQRAYQVVMQNRHITDYVSADFIPKAHDFEVGNIYNLRCDRRGILGPYRLLKMSTNRNKGQLVVSGNFENIITGGICKLHIIITEAYTTLVPVGDSGGNEYWQGQTFLSDEFDICGVWIYIVSTVGVPADMVLRLRGMFGGNPVNPILGSSNSRAVGGLTIPGWNQFSFAGEHVPAGTFFISVENIEGKGINNFYNIGCNPGNPYPDGSRWESNNVVWPPYPASPWIASAPDDLAMRIYSIQ